MAPETILEIDLGIASCGWAIIRTSNPEAKS